MEYDEVFLTSKRTPMMQDNLLEELTLKVQWPRAASLFMSRQLEMAVKREVNFATTSFCWLFVKDGDEGFH